MDKIRCLGCMQEYDSSMEYCPVCGSAKEFEQPEPYFLRVGTILENRYVIGKALSGGKFGITYLAYDLGADRKVVIKEYFPTDFASRMPGQNEISTYDGEKEKQFESGLRAFIEEATSLMNLSNSISSVAAVLDVFVNNSTAYSVAEYIDGLPLSKVLSNGILQWSDFSQIIEPLLQSLALIHSKGIINYNISPDNIIMTRDRQVKLLSFGGSKLATSGSNINLNVITKKGYSPVEMYREDITPDPSVDVYSIAAVMYYAITGIVPPDAVERSNNDTLKAPLELGIDIPENVNNAIMNALNVNRQYRTPDCETFLNELNSTGSVKRVIEEKKKDYSGKLGKKSKIIIVVAIIAAVAAIVSIVLVKATIDNKTTTTAVSSDTLKDYREHNLNDVQSELDEIDEEYDLKIKYKYQIDTKLKDDKKIIRKQLVKPDGETDLNKIKSITFTVTVPPVEMQNFIGKSSSETKKWLVDNGFDADNIHFSSVRSNAYKTGTVLSQSISIGAEITDFNKEFYFETAQNYTTTTRPPATQRRRSSGSNRKRSSGKKSGGSKSSGGKSSGGSSSGGLGFN